MIKPEEQKQAEKPQKQNTRAMPICPILKTECIANKCAWWDDAFSQCIIISISFEMERLLENSHVLNLFKPRTTH